MLVANLLSGPFSVHFSVPFLMLLNRHPGQGAEYDALCMCACGGEGLQWGEVGIIRLSTKSLQLPRERDRRAGRGAEGGGGGRRGQNFQAESDLSIHLFIHFSLTFSGTCTCSNMYVEISLLLEIACRAEQECV